MPFVPLVPTTKLANARQFFHQYTWQESVLLMRGARPNMVLTRRLLEIQRLCPPGIQDYENYQKAQSKVKSHEHIKEPGRGMISIITTAITPAATGISVLLFSELLFKRDRIKDPLLASAIGKPPHMNSLHAKASMCLPAIW